MSEFGEAIDTINKGYPVIFTALLGCDVFLEKLINSEEIPYKWKNAAKRCRENLKKANQHIEFRMS